MKHGFILLFMLLCNSVSYATSQVGDLLIYKGDTISVYYFIFDNYLQKSVHKEKFYERNKELIEISTGCWRGHQAVMELRNDSLFLKEVRGKNQQKMDIVPLFKSDKDIFIDWYTGTLTNPENCLIYVHDGWGGFHEFETDFIFEDGILKSVEKHHNTVKPSEYTNESTLTEFIKSNINYKNVTPVDSRIRVIVRIDDVNNDGKITKVSVLRGYNEEYDKEAVRVIKAIPNWDVIIQRGEKIHRYWYIPVIFEAMD